MNLLDTTGVWHYLLNKHSLQDKATVTHHPLDSKTLLDKLLVLLSLLDNLNLLDKFDRHCLMLHQHLLKKFQMGKQLD